MNKLISIAKLAGFTALIAIMAISALPSAGHAAGRLARPTATSAEAAASMARDCGGGNDFCFTRVLDNGTIIDYYLGPLLPNAE